LHQTIPSTNLKLQSPKISQWHNCHPVKTINKPPTTFSSFFGVVRKEAEREMKRNEIECGDRRKRGDRRREERERKKERGGRRGKRGGEGEAVL
jgi:hypothetical protein